MKKSKQKTVIVSSNYKFFQFTLCILSLFFKIIVIGLVVVPLWKIAYGPMVAINLFGMWKWLLLIFLRGFIPLALLFDLVYLLMIIWKLIHSKKGRKHGRRGK